MKILPVVKAIAIVLVLFFITREIASGLKYGSVTGVIMALGSMAAFAYVLYLLQKLRRVNNMEETAEEQ
ncbi:hypothetical protein [Sediminibacterium ginsengisoli]|uniref:Uncharacterized protein n=1 Tax=Sediminibacterium ginsengisoli TaxID=413434 RepID=A0A1T4RB10_9BACT|nr:hypothetical protein [Sediminibacterium ginsengisoli]SKA12888.1 hypothetical protein SAMN04488132_11168 [Sediminibacterium ginsengisoli]